MNVDGNEDDIYIKVIEESVNIAHAIKVLEVLKLLRRPRCY